MYAVAANKQAVGAQSSMTLGLTAKCVVYASFAGETWADVALIYDVEVAALKAANPQVTGDLAADTVLEVPGDCTTARAQVMEIKAKADESSALQQWNVLGSLGTAAVATALAVV